MHLSDLALLDPSAMASAPIGVSSHFDADMADMRSDTNTVAYMGANADTTDVNSSTNLCGSSAGAH